MLYNHLRSFMSHKLLVHLNPSDQSDDSADGVNELCAWVEIGGHHFRSFVDARQPVALREGGGGENSRE